MKNATKLIWLVMLLAVPISFAFAQADANKMTLEQKIAMDVDDGQGVIESNYETTTPMNTDSKGILLYETFDTQVPATWSQVVYSGTGVWEHVPTQTGGWYNALPPNSDGNYICCDSDGHSSWVYDVGIFTPSMDMSAPSVGILVDLDVAFNSLGTNDIAGVYVYSGGVYEGYFYNNVGVDDISHKQWLLPPPASIGFTDPSDVQFEFYYSTAGGTWQWGFAIDNLRVELIEPTTLYGYVFNGGGLTIAGATVGIENTTISTVSGPDGYYELLTNAGPQVAFGTKAGYNYITHALDLPPNTATQQDFILTAPTMIISPTSHTYTLNPNEYFTTATGILNTGDGPLEWSASVVYPPTDGIPVNPGTPPVIEYGDEIDPLAPSRVGAKDKVVDPGATEDVWDPVNDWPYPGSLNWGIGFANGNVWLSDYYSPTTVTEYNTDGSPTGNSITMSYGQSWIGDMAGWQDDLFAVMVGGDNQIKHYKTDGTFVAAIGGAFTSTSQRGVAYNPNGDGGNGSLFVGGWNSDNIWEVDMSGTTINSYYFDAVAGLAYHPNGNGGLGSLWVVPSSPSDVVYEVIPEDGTVLNTYPLPAGGAGYGGAGMALASNGNFWMPNQNTSRIYEVEGIPLSGAGGWLTLDYYSNTVPPGGGLDNVPTNFDAAGTAAGEVYTADIVFTSNPNVGTITIPCTMIIAGDPLVPPTDLTVELVNDITGAVELNWTWVSDLTFQYFIIKRDGTILGTATETTYMDMLPDYGNYCYTVQALYDEGTSSESNEECVEWPLPEIFVDPTYHYAEVWVDHQYMWTTNISNTGIGTLTYEISQTLVCEHSIVLWDSFGDGWNGGRLDVFVDGVLVLNDITLSSGYGPATYYFVAESGKEISTVYTAGSWSYENYYYIYDGDGTQIAADGLGGTTPGGVTVDAFCSQGDFNFVVDIDPMSGVVPQGTTQQVNITWDATGFAPYSSYIETLFVTSNDPVTPVVNIDNEMYVYVPAELVGTVTECESGSPLPGVTVTAGAWQTLTDQMGEYSLFVDEDVYDVYFDKLGYGSYVEPALGIFLPGPTTLDVCLYEAPYPVPWVIATVNYPDEDFCDVEWSLPEGPYEVSYDDGEAEDLFAWSNAGGENAVKFTPAGYPANIFGGRIYVGTGLFPSGNWLGTEFAVLIYADDAGLPGAVLDSTGVTVNNYGWVEFGGLNVTLEEGDFFMSMYQLNDAPNTAPIGVDNTFPLANRSYQRNEIFDWQLSVYQDFMMRAYIEGPQTDDVADGTTMVYPTKTDREMLAKEIITANNTPFSVQAGVELKGQIGLIEGYEYNGEEVLYYTVARVSDFDPTMAIDPPVNGTLTVLNNVTEFNYVDNDFSALTMGWYAYGVQVAYSSGMLSPWTFSNIVGRDKDAVVTFEITLCDGNVPEDVEVSMQGLAYPFELFTAVSDETGIVTFDQVWKGMYEVELYKIGYEAVNFVQNVTEDITIPISISEKRYPVRNLWVDPLTSYAYWDPPLVVAVEEDFNGLTFPPNGWQATSNSIGWFQTTDGSSSFWTIPSWDSPYACSNDDAAGSAGDGSMDYLITPPLDLREVDTYKLTFDSYFDGAFSQLAFVEYSLDAGANWTVLYGLSPNPGSWAEIEVDLAGLSGMGGTAPVWVAFHADDNGTWASGWAVDNVSIANGETTPVAYHVYLDGALDGITDTTFYQFEYLQYGTAYTACVAAEYSCGLSPEVCVDFLSIFLLPPRNLDGLTFDNTVHVWWEPPMIPVSDARINELGVTPVGPISTDKDAGPEAGISGTGGTSNGDAIGTCAPESIYANDPTTISGAWSARTSSAALGYTVFTDFTGLTENIGTLRFWGLSLFFSGGWSQCGNDDPRLFVVKFYEPGSLPGAELYSFDLYAPRIPTGDLAAGFDVFEWTVNVEDAMPGGVNLDEGWVSIQVQDSDCDWLWWNAEFASGSAVQWDGATYTPQADPQSLCIGAATGGGGGGGVPDNLLGYNLYRDMDNIAFVPYNDEDTTHYFDYELEPLCYAYDVTALYDLTPYGFPGETAESMYEGTFDVCVEYGWPLTFTEDWNTGSFDPNLWTAGDNWVINGQFGNPYPCAEFKWDPVLVDYKSSLESYAIDGKYHPITGDEYVDGRIWFDFDLALEDNGMSGDETLVVEIWDGGTWYQVATYSNADGSFDWMSEHFEISDHAFGKIFKVRFTADGVNSTGILSWFVDNIVIYRQCDEPLNLTADGIDPFTIELNWSPPAGGGGGGGTIGEWLTYDLGYEGRAIGFGGAAVWSVASRWEPAALAAYEGTSITKVTFVPGANSNASTFTIKIWEGANAATLIYEEDVPTVLLGEYNEITLATPVPIDVTKELWFGYTTEQFTADDFPAGCDEGPATSNYGDLLTADGTTWESMSLVYGLDYNWSLLAYVTDETDGSAPSIPLVDNTVYSTPSNAPQDNVVPTAPVSYNTSSSRALTGYNVYYNDNGTGYVFAAFTEDTTFTHVVDPAFEVGTNQCYYVTAVYEDCEPASNEACVMVTGIEDPALVDGIAVYPNPARDILNITSSTDITHVTVMNYVGQVVYNQKVVEDNDLQLNVAGYETGVYIVKVETTAGIVTKKITIAH